MEESDEHARNDIHDRKSERKILTKPVEEGEEQTKAISKPTEEIIRESIIGPDLVEKTNAEIKDLMQKTFPKARDEVYNNLIIKQKPMTTSDHMRLFIRLNQEETNNPRLSKLNQIAAAAHVQIMRELNSM